MSRALPSTKIQHTWTLRRSDAAEIQSRARQSGMSVSDYVRALALREDLPPRPRPTATPTVSVKVSLTTQQFLELRTRADRMGATIPQLLHWAVFGGGAQ